jgi:hypothetical protein
MSLHRSYLSRCRLADLPTVWSNSLAGWWLGGGGNTGRLPLLLAGTTLLYLGGALFNDAFETRSERRLSSAPRSTSSAVQGGGLVLLALGALGLFWVGKAAGSFGAGLAVLIVVYQLIPWRAASWLLLPGVCRFLIYLIAVSSAQSGVNPLAIWCGLALAAYVVGVKLIARQEGVAGPARHWPMLLLVIPIALALVVDGGPRREAGLLLSAVLALWAVRCLRPALWSAEKDFAGATAGLVAGIVFVDLLAAANGPKALSLVFLLLFGATLLLQRARLFDSTTAQSSQP